MAAAGAADGCFQAVSCEPLLYHCKAAGQSESHLCDMLCYMGHTTHVVPPKNGVLHQHSRTNLQPL
jgi:hypothetical protein